VNTAARMESAGPRYRVHVSEETAQLLTEAGKTSSLTPREETVQAKGKGELTTYWVFENNHKRGSTSASTVTSSDSSLGSLGSAILDPSTNMGAKALMCDRRGRLIDWNVDLFAGLIRKIVARRGA